MNRTFRKWMATTLTFALIGAISERAEAALAPAPAPQHHQILDRAADVQTVQSFLEKKEVKAHLEKMGLSKSEVHSRLSSLTDAEIHDVASQIETQNPAGDGAGVVVTVLVIGILALLFVYLLK